MPIQAINTSEVVAAEQIAQAIVTDILQTAKRVAQLRATGRPEQPEQPARTSPDGRLIQPARAAIPAVSAAAINEALGEANCALMDQLLVAIMPT